MDVIVTDKATFRMIDGQLTVTRLEDGVPLDEVRDTTGAAFVDGGTVAATTL